MKLFTKEDQETIEKLQQEVQYLRNVLDESTREMDRKNEELFSVVIKAQAFDRLDNELTVLEEKNEALSTAVKQEQLANRALKAANEGVPALTARVQSQAQRIETLEAKLEFAGTEIREARQARDNAKAGFTRLKKKNERLGDLISLLRG